MANTKLFSLESIISVYTGRYFGNESVWYEMRDLEDYVSNKFKLADEFYMGAIQPLVSQKLSVLFPELQRCNALVPLIIKGDKDNAQQVIEAMKSVSELGEKLAV